MQNKNEWEELGRDLGRTISRTVRDVVHSQDVKGLSEDIKHTVREVTDGISKWGEDIRKEEPPMQNTPQNTGRYQYPSHHEKQPGYRPKYNLDLSRAGKIPSVSWPGVGLIALGTLLFILSGIFGVVGSIQFLSGLQGALWGLLPLAGISMGSGIWMNVRQGRYAGYQRLLEGKRFMEIKELAEKSGHSRACVRRDWDKILSKNWVEAVFMDEDGECLFVDREIYQEYLQAKAQMARQEQEEAQRRSRPMTEAEETVAEGRAYLQRFHEADRYIIAQAPSEKIEQLCQIAENIFRYVEKHPEQLPDIRKLMTYYLPTTEKLLNSYREMEAQPIQGENIQKTRREIEGALDVEIEAFEKLLDGMFGDDAIDVSTDISVLNAMLAQEGLAGEDFDKKKTHHDDITLE